MLVGGKIPTQDLTYSNKATNPIRPSKKTWVYSEFELEIFGFQLGVATD
jgi:hypothetical protein